MRYIIIALLLMSLSVDAQKKVVIEKFTNTSCGTCPNASLVLQDIVSRYDDVIWVSHYKNNGWFDNPLTNDQTAQLWDDISVPGNPLGMIDRIPVDNFLLLTSSRWEDRIQEQLNETVLADVIIDDVDYDKENRTISFSTGVTFLQDMPSGDYRISAMIVEDGVTGQAQNSYYNDVAGHPLEGMGNPIWNYEHHNVVRAILDDTWGTDNVVPSEPVVSETYIQSYSYIVPEEYKPAQIKIVCMVTRHDESDVLNRRVYNADEVSLSDIELQLTGQADIVDDKSIVIFPNPANRMIYVDSDGTPTSYTIIDIQGREISNGSINSQREIDISHLDNGIYTLMLNFSNNISVAKLTIAK